MKLSEKLENNLLKFCKLIKEIIVRKKKKIFFEFYFYQKFTKIKIKFRENFKNF